MMTPMETYLRRGRRTVRRWWSDPKLRKVAKGIGCTASGFFLSATSLMHHSQPLAMGLTAALTGWPSLAAGLGAVVGYRIYWGKAGFPGVAWAIGGCLAAQIMGRRENLRDQPLLLPALCALVVSATGILFQLLGQENSGLPVYLLRVILSGVSTMLFQRFTSRRDTLTNWLTCGTAVLALSRAIPLPWLNPGVLAGAVLAVGGASPVTAIAGIGLDLAGITPVPMTAVLCMAYLTRMIPVKPHIWRMAAPAAACTIVMAVQERWDLALLPGLLVGGALGLLLPPRVPLHHRRGETGLAQVRLELTARILQETRQQLLEPSPSPPNTAALVDKIRQSLCAGCSAQAECTTTKILSLHNPDIRCSQPEKLFPELHRARDQLRQMTADRLRREEYRLALVQQYDFLAEYLRSLADLLPRRGDRIQTAYAIRCAARSAGKEPANGDRCLAFPGTGGRYYVLLCDGMGTGLGAAREGDSAAGYLRQMLLIGFPAKHALRSLNSILVLKGKGGAVTMDLAEMDLSNGKATLYKWGASPSWILKKQGAEKIGTATPPPGLSLSGTREESVQLSLRGGEVLILLSDGVEAGETLRRMEHVREMPPGELAQAVLNAGCSGDDDATVAVICLQKLR